MLAAVSWYELLVVVLRRHRPSERAGLCMVCGTGWPCAEVLLPVESSRIPGETNRPDERPTGMLSRVHG